MPTNSFKSPVSYVMQQGNLFAALLPDVNVHHAETPAMDLDVTSKGKPWMSYAQFRASRMVTVTFGAHPTKMIQAIDNGVDNVVTYGYSLVISEQPPRLGYRRVVRLLWERLGHPSLIASSDEQQNVLRHELSSFARWRNQAWKADPDRLYASFACGDKQCGTLSSDRTSSTGKWTRNRATRRLVQSLVSDSANCLLGWQRSP